MLIRSLDAIPPRLRQGAVTIGNFDGVHLGHARIIERLIATARDVGGPAVVFTFDPHPVRILRPKEAPAPLTWTTRKAELLLALGVDSIVACPTDEALLNLSDRQFFEQIIRERLEARALVEGPNFFFGRDRTGTVEVLRELASQSNVGLEVVEPVFVEGQMVSSSRVRKLLAAGHVDQARSMLTEPYRVRGLITHGAGRGARLGFPTANVDAIDTLLPGVGVYAGRAWVRGDRWPAAINIGPNPTFGEHAVKLEVHLIGANEHLYGEVLEVDFVQRLREIHAFSGMEALRAQLTRDVQTADEVVRHFEA